MSPLDEVIEKNQINLAHLYQYYESALQFRKMPYTGNHLFGSYGEMVKKKNVLDGLSVMK